MWRFTCPPGLKFDAKIGGCNWETEVDGTYNTEAEAETEADAETKAGAVGTFKTQFSGVIS